MSYTASDVFKEKQPHYDRSLAAFAAKKINVLELHKQPGCRFLVVRHQDDDDEEIVALAVAREIDAESVSLETLIVTDGRHRLGALVEILEALFTDGYFCFRRRPDDNAEYELLTGPDLGFETIGSAPDWTVELRVTSNPL